MKIAIAMLAVMTIVNPAFAGAKEKFIDVQVTENGFEPKSIDVSAGTSVSLKVTRKTDSTCATEIQVRSKNIKEKLPLNKTITIALGKLEKGEIRFGCGMDMLTGQIIVK